MPLLLLWPLQGAWPATQACALPGNQTSDPLVLWPALSPLSHTSQGAEKPFFTLGFYFIQTAGVFYKKERECVLFPLLYQ